MQRERANVLFYFSVKRMCAQIELLLCRTFPMLSTKYCKTVTNVISYWYVYTHDLLGVLQAMSTMCSIRFQ